jgi:hypothetical protein
VGRARSRPGTAEPRDLGGWPPHACELLEQGRDLELDRRRERSGQPAIWAALDGGIDGAGGVHVEAQAAGIGGAGSRNRETQAISTCTCGGAGGQAAGTGRRGRPRPGPRRRRTGRRSRPSLPCTRSSPAWGRRWDPDQYPTGVEEGKGDFLFLIYLLGGGLRRIIL